MKRSELRNTLELTAMALADSNLVPVFQCFCFSKDEVKAYNDKIGIIAQCPLTDEFVVNGKILLGWLKNNSADNLEFKLTDQDVTIKADRSTFKLPFLPVEDFIFEEPDANGMTSEPLTEDFLDGLRACLTTTSKDQSQPALMGISFVNRSTLFGCDGDAVTKFSLDSKPEADEIYFLSNDFCSTVLHISKTTECVEGTLALSNEWAVVDFNNGYSIYGRLIQNDNPIDFENLITKTVKGKPTFVPVPAGLDDALLRSMVITNIETVPTVFTVEANRLKLLTDARSGTVRDSLAIGKHPEVQASFSAEMVKRTIALCDEICIMENCLVGRKGDKLFQVVSTMDTGK